MKIVHFIATLGTRAGGPARAVLDLSTAMARRGHSVTVLTKVPPQSGTDDDDRSARHDRVSVVNVGAGSPGVWSPSGIARVREIVRAHDVLHLHGMWDPANLLLAVIAAREKRPYVVSIRGMLDDWSMSQRYAKKRLYLALVGRRWLAGASAIHLTAQRELEQARKYFPERRGHVIPNLIDMSAYASVPLPRPAGDGDAGRVMRILFIGRVHEKKGIEVLLSAVARARASCDVRVAVAGDGEPRYVRKVKELADTLCIRDSVEFIGHVSGARKVSAYAEADLVVLPTQQENFGFVFFEALSCGRPLVTSPDIDMASELEGSGGAVIVERDPEKLAEVLRWFREDVGRLRDYGARGRAWVLRELSADAIVERFEEFYERIGRVMHLPRQPFRAPS